MALSVACKVSDCSVCSVCLIISGFWRPESEVISFTAWDTPDYLLWVLEGCHVGALPDLFLDVIKIPFGGALLLKNLLSRELVDLFAL